MSPLVERTSASGKLRFGRQRLQLAHSGPSWPTAEAGAKPTLQPKFAEPASRDLRESVLAQRGGTRIDGVRSFTLSKSRSTLLDRVFTAIASRIATSAGQPQAFILAFSIIILWGVTGPFFGFSDTWQLVVNTATTIVTFLMVFLIQNSQNRDGAAMQAKLDELLRAVNNARGQFIGIEHLTDRQIEDIRAALEREVGKEPGKQGTADDSVENLLDRY